MAKTMRIILRLAEHSRMPMPFREKRGFCQRLHSLPPVLSAVLCRVYVRVWQRMKISVGTFAVARRNLSLAAGTELQTANGSKR